MLTLASNGSIQSISILNLIINYYKWEVWNYKMTEQIDLNYILYYFIFLYYCLYELCAL